MNHALIEKECFPYCYLRLLLLITYSFFFFLEYACIKIKEPLITFFFFFLLYLMLLKRFTFISETLRDVSPGSLFLFLFIYLF